MNSYLVLVRPHERRLLGISEPRGEDIRMNTRVIDWKVKIKVNTVSLPTPVAEPKISQVMCYFGVWGLRLTTREVGM